MPPAKRTAPNFRLSAASAAAAVVGIVLLLAGRLPVSRCQPDAADSYPMFSRQVNEMISNLTKSVTPQIKHQLGSCISDPSGDFNTAFNYSNNFTFFTNCLSNTPDLLGRLCTAAEIKFYFASFFASGEQISYLKPNENCNLSSWTPGCEPGWACRTDLKNVSLSEVDYTPSRTAACKPICEGFFSPYGITCMIPCPLGAYCPLATFNETTGYCDPYKYQPSAGRMNDTCGGADIWADIVSSSDIFCPAGFYCPSTIEKLSCSSGYYCRIGSTSETRCFGASSCKPNSAHQDIKLFGGLVLVAMCLLLLIIYNFSDQILTIRERRQAKSRENAARIARESAVARERWKAAKAIVLKHASGLHNQFSRRFSHTRLSKQLELPTVDDQAEHSSEESTTDCEEESALSKKKYSSEESSDSYEGFHANTGDSKSKKKMPQSKHIHTRTQILTYAYDRIEKEKVTQQEKNMTLSGVISMATKNESRTRPLIEVAFNDLTLTLKRKKKQLLKCVTGKLMPGRITAVMGPSGAGKTTFLTALAGKTAGCEITGSVLINGKAEPIRSYKRIIGFVPQDDIVHGDLTVEENLWFSARCRLPADLPIEDKVLVVERAIESLGLQAVRDSLVGTVENRGISGGQRKRVNVGLEMVMEPSLMILDEPTSGLDSSSSQLLLRALRREALVGVNICMVVHQPSYTLFNMFDDFILLAKGGFIVYHGPVNRVEEYFSGLGINVPDRVNPPDYYIDILEGVVKPSLCNSIKCNQMPLMWMLHNGYDIPPDMQNELDAIDASLRDVGTGSARSVDQHSVNSEIWDLLEEKKHHLRFFSKSKNLTSRRTPGILEQYKYYLGRVCKQRLREVRVQVLDLLILGLAGVCLGLLAKLNDENLGVAGYSFTTIAVSLLCQIGALRSFSHEKLQYMRERASGMSSLAYFLSKDTIDHFNTVVKPVVYLSMFYFLNNPRSTFTDNYIILLALVYCVTGIGYTFAICFQTGAAQLWSALLPVVLTLISTRTNVPVVLRNLCYPKWALEAFVVANARRYTGVWLITRCGLLMEQGYNINYWGLCIAMLFVYGLVFRCIAFICMLLLHKR